MKFKVLLGFTIAGEHRVYPDDLVEGSDIGNEKEIKYKQARGFISLMPVEEPAAKTNGGKGNGGSGGKGNGGKKGDDES